MKLKPLAAAALLATSASAFSASLGTLGDDPVFFNGTGSGLVFDTWTFSLSEVSNLTVDLLGSTSPRFSFANLGVALLDSSFNVLGTSSVGGPLSLSLSNLGAGDYAIAVTGFTSGSAGGAYTGILAAAPVPEPETYALMLAGLGIVGFIASRRRQNQGV